MPDDSEQFSLPGIQETVLCAVPEAPPEAPATATAQTIFGDFAKWHKDSFGVGLALDRRQIGHLTKCIKELLRDNYPDTSIKWALLAWQGERVAGREPSPQRIMSLAMSHYMRNEHYPALMAMAHMATESRHVNGSPKPSPGATRAQANASAVEQYRIANERRLA